MNNLLNIKNLKKDYADFSLDNVSFKVPQGTIVGLIGENGAGKSTVIKSVLGLIKVDGGMISILGQDNTFTKDVKEQIGVVFDSGNFPENYSPYMLNKLMKILYTTWDENVYFSLLHKLSLPLKKKIKQFSKGMKMKLAIITAFSHHARLLILDEPTGGLDPIIRDDILDLFLDFVQDESNAILVSSHITSDLEKIADHIVFIHEGKIIFEKPKDELMYRYGLLKCGKSQFERLDKGDIVTCLERDYEWQVLTDDRDRMQKKYPDMLISPATIDEIMMLYIRGKRV